jgi:hypothetical protein
MLPQPSATETIPHRAAAHGLLQVLGGGCSDPPPLNQRVLRAYFLPRKECAHKTCAPSTASKSKLWTSGFRLIVLKWIFGFGWVFQNLTSVVLKYQSYPLNFLLCAAGWSSQKAPKVQKNGVSRKTQKKFKNGETTETLGFQKNEELRIFKLRSFFVRKFLKL